MSSPQRDERLLRRFGARVRALRRAAGLSQQALADRARMDWRYLGAVERAQQNPSLEVIGRIARGLDLPVDQLFYLEEPALASADRVAERRVRYALERAPGPDKALLHDLIDRVLAWTATRPAPPRRRASRR